MNSQRPPGVQRDVGPGRARPRSPRGGRRPPRGPLRPIAVGLAALPLAVGCGAPAPYPAPQSGGAARSSTPPNGAGATPASPPSAEDRGVRVLRGRASYYSDALAGRSTASGEPYDPRALTAASRDLPFGTRVRVTRTDTGASVVVRINDRGPFRDHRRILDLSRAAAEALDMIRAGVVPIEAEILGAGTGR